MESDSDDYGPGFNEDAYAEYIRDCEEAGGDVFSSELEELLIRKEVDRIIERERQAYAELNAASRVVMVSRATKRRRIDDPSSRTEVALASLGVGPLSAAFSFLHPVELARVEMTAKAVRESVDAAWRSIFKRVVCRPGHQRWTYFLVQRKIEEYSSAECRRAVILEEGWLRFGSDLGQLSHMAGNSLRPPHPFPPGSLSDLLQKRYIFVKEQCEDDSFPSGCKCGEVNRSWCQLFPDKPLRCVRCKEFDLALDCMDLAMVCIDAEIEDDRNESLWIHEWEEKNVCQGYM